MPRKTNHSRESAHSTHDSPTNNVKQDILLMSVVISFVLSPQDECWSPRSCEQTERSTGCPAG